MATITPQHLEKYHELVSQGWSQRAACKALGVARATLQVQLRKALHPKKGPRILLLDFETAPSLAYVFGRWKQNIRTPSVVREGAYFLTGAWKWLGNPQVHAVACADPVHGDDFNICIDLYEALEQADAVVAHNLDAFDWPLFLTRLVQNGILPPRTVKHIDTLKIARKNFRFNSNKLDDLARYLNVGQKIETDMTLWVEACAGNAAAMRKMVEYNIQDIQLLEAVYLALRAFDSNPQLNASHYYVDTLLRCPVCGSSDVEDSGGEVFTPVSAFVEMKCNTCGHRSRKRQPHNTKEKRASVLVTPR